MGSETKEGLIEVLNTRPAMMRCFNQYLRRRHGIAITGHGEAPDGETKIFVRGKKHATLRTCKHDGQLYSLARTMEWALTWRKATVNWTLEFWERDFLH